MDESTRKHLLQKLAEFESLQRDIRKTLANRSERPESTFPGYMLGNVFDDLLVSFESTVDRMVEELLKRLRK